MKRNTKTVLLSEEEIHTLSTNQFDSKIHHLQTSKYFNYKVRFYLGYSRGNINFVEGWIRVNKETATRLTKEDVFILLKKKVDSADHKIFYGYVVELQTKNGILNRETNEISLVEFLCGKNRKHRNCRFKNMLRPTDWTDKNIQLGKKYTREDIENSNIILGQLSSTSNNLPSQKKTKRKYTKTAGKPPVDLISEKGDNGIDLLAEARALHKKLEESNGLFKHKIKVKHEQNLLLLQNDLIDLLVLQNQQESASTHS